MSKLHIVKQEDFSFEGRTLLSLSEDVDRGDIFQYIFDEMHAHGLVTKKGNGFISVHWWWKDNKWNQSGESDTSYNVKVKS